MNTQQRIYSRFVKPSWSPPAWLFGPVWLVLYAIIAIAFGRVGYMYGRGDITGNEAFPFVLNVVSNLTFTYIQFTLQNNLLASLDILIVWVTLVWAIWTIYDIEPWIAYALAPYLLWVSFATVLQLTITWLNW